MHAVCDVHWGPRLSLHMMGRPHGRELRVWASSISRHAGGLQVLMFKCIWGELHGTRTHICITADVSVVGLCWLQVKWKDACIKLSNGTEVSSGTSPTMSTHGPAHACQDPALALVVAFRLHPGAYLCLISATL
jgi:hypothetical protein